MPSTARTTGENTQRGAKQMRRHKSLQRISLLQPTSYKYNNIIMGKIDANNHDLQTVHADNSNSYLVENEINNGDNKHDIGMFTASNDPLQEELDQNSPSRPNS